MFDIETDVSLNDVSSYPRSGSQERLHPKDRQGGAAVDRDHRAHDAIILGSCIGGFYLPLLVCVLVL